MVSVFRYQARPPLVTAVICNLKTYARYSGWQYA